MNIDIEINAEIYRTLLELAKAQNISFDSFVENYFRHLVISAKKASS